MEIVYHISEKDLETLVMRMVTRLQEKHTEQDVWLTPQEAMRRLNIKSKTSLYYLRVNGEILYTQPRKRIIMYSSESIDQFLLKKAKKIF